MAFSQIWEEGLLASSGLSVRPAVRMEQLGSHWADFHEILYLSILKKTAGKNKVPLKSDKNNGTVHEDQYTFLIVSRLVLLRLRNVSDKSCRENQTYCVR